MNTVGLHVEAKRGLDVKLTCKGYATTLGVGLETRSIPGMGHIKSSYTVVGIETTLRLRWQDGSENTETSLNVVPYRNVDE